MEQEELLKIAKSITTGMDKILGKEFVPVNLQTIGFSRAELRWSRLKIGLIREKETARHADEAAMLAEISQVARSVKAFKQGACGELAMYAYNVARNVPGTSPQILFAAGKRDKHALVLLGVTTKFATATAVSAIAESDPKAVVIDYWAAQNGARSDATGVFPIADYEDDAEDALSKYDLKKLTTWSFT